MTHEGFDLLLLGGGLVTAGVVGGLVAGLLGVGGGIIVVPALYYLLGALGFDESIRMHVATGTSLATIVPTAFSSIRAHDRRKAVDWDVAKRWMPAMIAGVVVGACLSGLASGRTLALVFACTALPVALHLAIAKDRVTRTPATESGALSRMPAFITGGLSTMMGIGGGTIGVPVLTLSGAPIHRAVGTASVFGAVIAVPGTIGAMIAGASVRGLPPLSIGYVNMLGFALIAPAAFLLAPVGARLAHSLDRTRLRLCFIAFLLLTAGRMLYNAIY